MKSGKVRFFGIGRILGRLQSYKLPLLIMLLTSAAGSVVDIGVPVFQRYALNHFVGLGTLQGLPEVFQCGIHLPKAFRRVPAAEIAVEIVVEPHSFGALQVDFGTWNPVGGEMQVTCDGERVVQDAGRMDEGFEMKFLEPPSDVVGETGTDEHQRRPVGYGVAGNAGPDGRTPGLG